MPPAFIYLPLSVSRGSATLMQNSSVAVPLRCAVAGLTGVELTRVAVNSTFDYATQAFGDFNASSPANRVDTCNLREWERRQTRRYLWAPAPGGWPRPRGVSGSGALAMEMGAREEDAALLEEDTRAMAHDAAVALAWVARMLADGGGGGGGNGTVEGFSVTLSILIPPDPASGDVEGAEAGRGLGAIRSMNATAMRIIAVFEAMKAAGNVTMALSAFAYAVAEASGLNATLLLQEMAFAPILLALPPPRPPSPSASPPPAPPLLTTDEIVAISVAGPLVALVMAVLGFEAYRRKWRRVQRERRAVLEKQRHGEEKAVQGSPDGRPGTLRRAGAAGSSSRVHVDVDGVPSAPSSPSARRDGAGAAPADARAAAAAMMQSGVGAPGLHAHREGVFHRGSAAAVSPLSEGEGEGGGGSGFYGGEAAAAMQPGRRIAAPARRVSGLGTLPPIPLHNTAAFAAHATPGRITLSKRPGLPVQGWGTPSGSAAPSRRASGAAGVLAPGAARADLAARLRGLDAAVHGEAVDNFAVDNILRSMATGVTPIPSRRGSAAPGSATLVRAVPPSPGAAPRDFTFEGEGAGGDAAAGGGRGRISLGRRGASARPRGGTGGGGLSPVPVPGNRLADSMPSTPVRPGVPRSSGISTPLRLDEGSTSGGIGGGLEPSVGSLDAAIAAAAARRAASVAAAPFHLQNPMPSSRAAAAAAAAASLAQGQRTPPRVAGLMARFQPGGGSGGAGGSGATITASPLRVLNVPAPDSADASSGDAGVWGVPPSGRPAGVRAASGGAARARPQSTAGGRPGSPIAEAASLPMPLPGAALRKLSAVVPPSVPSFAAAAAAAGSSGEGGSLSPRPVLALAAPHSRGAAPAIPPLARRGARHPPAAHPRRRATGAGDLPPQRRGCARHPPRHRLRAGREGHHRAGRGAAVRVPLRRAEAADQQRARPQLPAPVPPVRGPGFRRRHVNERTREGGRKRSTPSFRPLSPPPNTPLRVAFSPRTFSPLAAPWPPFPSPLGV
jgi:hypothetical protein